MLIDTHMHTRFSTDSEMLLTDARNRAAELGLGMIITEHLDLQYPEPDEFTFDIDAYFAEYGPVRSEQLMLGVEVGMRLDCVENSRRIVAAYPFDYVIGSIHVINDIDLYWQSFYTGRTKAEVYDQYFSAMLACIKAYDFVDSLGHIDYISRYASFADPSIYYHEFASQIDSVLSVLAARGQALEINTKRPLTAQSRELLAPIFKRFAALGGQYATLGSDAHRASEVGRGLQEAFVFAQDCGLRPVYFKERTLHYMTL